MKTHLNLGLAFVDSHGSLRVSLQLMTDQSGSAVASTDFVNGACERFHVAKVGAMHATAFRVEANECAQLATIKSLEWSYPTSDNARLFGHPTGCWTIKLGLVGHPSHAVRAFPKDQKAYALHCTQVLPFKWSLFTESVHPEYLQLVKGGAL